MNPKCPKCGRFMRLRKRFNGVKYWICPTNTSCKVEPVIEHSFVCFKAGYDKVY